MATGVLPLVIGRATRLAQFLTASDKSYDATIAFGRTTDTYDARGREVTSCTQRPTREQLDAAVARFRGEFEQTPPAYSAKNIDGERSYELARKAEQRGRRAGSLDLAAPVRPKPVTVATEHLEVLAFDGDTAKLAMTVTAGFYVRSLAHDLGEALGCGAVLVALRRTRSGEFGLDPAVPLADVLQSKREDVATHIVPMSALLGDLPAVTLRGASTVERLKNGVEMGPSDLVAPLEQSFLTAAPEAPQKMIIVRLMGPDGGLIGLAKPAKTPGFLHGWVVLG